MGRVIKGILLTVFFCQFSFYASAFTCRTSDGVDIGEGTLDVYVPLAPELRAGQNLVVDLSPAISCKNDASAPGIDDDLVSIVAGSGYGGSLTRFNGSLYYYGIGYAFPTTSNTAQHRINQQQLSSWDVKLFLTPIGNASEVLVQQGEVVAIIKMYKIATTSGNPRNFQWNIRARNAVKVPTGGCTISTRDVNVNLPVYPATQNFNVNVRCAQTRALSYFIDGSVTGANNDIFINTATASPAQGVGVQISNSNGALKNRERVYIGQVDTGWTSIPLRASYARTTGTVTAGSVRSVINMTFQYP